MKPEIKTFLGIQLIGKCQTMSFAEDKTFLLWNSFMPRQNEINDKIGEELFNVVCYPDNFDFNPNKLFEKWATVPVNEVVIIPEGMKTLIISEGLYAVFIYKGKNTEAESFFKYIFMEWIPKSVYELDNRPHFEILGSKYKNNDSDSEEEVYIPIRNKG